MPEKLSFPVPSNAIFCNRLSVQPEMIAQIHPANLGIVAQILWPSLAENLATFQDVRSVGNRQGLSHVMVRDQHADAGLGQSPNDFLQVFYGQRVNARKGFV